LHENNKVTIFMLTFSSWKYFFSDIKFSRIKIKLNILASINKLLFK